MTVRTLPSLLVASLVGAALVGACGSSGGTSSNGGGGSSSGGGSGGGNAEGGSGGGPGLDGSLGSSSGGGGSGSSSGGGAFTDASFACDGCAPFPPSGTPTCATTTLGPPTLVYPPNGVLLPPNMNVLEVQWTPPAGATLFEVDFTNGSTDVRVETPCNAITSVRGTANAGCGLTLPQAAWNDIANTNRGGDPVQVTVRATTSTGSCVASSAQNVAINFAQEDLSGGIYYWQSATYGGVAGTTGGIFYHDFGTFTPTPTPFWTSGSTGTCVGCHTLSKDGARMSLMTDDPDADDEYGDVKTLTLDVASRTALGGANVGPGFQTFSHDHALMVASTFKMGQNKSFTVWSGDGHTLLATDALPMMGMTSLLGTQPNLSADDKTLVFVAPGYAAGGMSTISQAGDHHFLGASLWSASFNAATYALSGYKAILPATGTQNFYYPDQSVDGNWVVFNENDDASAANDDGDCFYSRKSRVKIMHFPPQTGDQPLELTNLNVADGLSNSWPRWSPVVQNYKTHKILWVTFSSNRDYGVRLANSGFDNYYPPESPAYDQPQPATKMGITFDKYAAPQIWMAAIIVDPDRTLDSADRSLPAFWLPFQDVTAHNHSAQWVASVQGGPPGMGGDGGAGEGGAGDGGGTDASNQGGADGSGGTCGEPTAACSASALCCSDAICCGAFCAYTCNPQ
jgi:hypothetical protein